MSRMRGLACVGCVAVLTLGALAGCRSGPSVPRDGREPPIAGRQGAADGIVQTSATESTTACKH
jgi:hypothetical protein